MMIGNFAPWLLVSLAGLLMTGCAAPSRQFVYSEAVCRVEGALPRGCTTGAVLKLFAERHLDRADAGFASQLLQLDQRLRLAEQVEDEVLFHDLVDDAVRDFGDGHSRYIVPAGAARIDKLIVEGSLVDGKPQEFTVHQEKGVLVLGFRTLGRAGVGKRFGAAVRVAYAAKPGCVLLDLRDNVGGIIEEAEEVMALWLTGGLRYGDAASFRGSRPLKVPPGQRPLDEAIPLTILVNGGTASASEILALALAERINVTVYGRSAGRSELLGAYITPAGGRLLLTEEEMRDANGRSVRHLGIDGRVPTGDGEEAIRQAISNGCGSYPAG